MAKSGPHGQSRFGVSHWLCYGHVLVSGLLNLSAPLVCTAGQSYSVGGWTDLVINKEIGKSDDSVDCAFIWAIGCMYVTLGGRHPRIYIPAREA